ncbi:hypothetical protein FHS18_000948 [Paenibacillus phyllosphaerae]|uniref:Uncharacterized protein n=1 Tax=Paenibacillus phyllosphaerae TaxID=274593 RepID=A0A7W5FL82_9BACL|nr:hypothetical protein [Paenibacillus phyllosphaerae]MBB3108896.1 hypothetical protein [Paenibacillus phyllosphaerae]
MLNKAIMWAFWLVPFASLFFFNSVTLRRYMPVAWFATVLNTIVYQMAWAYGWWKYKETLLSWDKVAQVHTVYGAFFVGTLWIFRLTFRKFWLYAAVNLGVDFVYAFGLRALWKSLGITSGGKLPPIGSVAIMTVMALMLYAYQMWQEGAFTAKRSEQGGGTGKVRVTWISRSFGRQVRQGAK